MEINATADLRAAIFRREIDARRRATTSHVNIVNLVDATCKQQCVAALINRRWVINGRTGTETSRDFIRNFNIVDLHLCARDEPPRSS